MDEHSMVLDFLPLLPTMHIAIILYCVSSDRSVQHPDHERAGVRV